MTIAAFTSRTFTFDDGTVVAAPFRTFCGLRDIPPVFATAGRRAHEAPSSTGHVKSEILAADTTIFYFGDGSALDDPEDDWSLDMLAQRLGAGKRCLVYVSEAFPREILRRLSLTPEAVVDDATTLKARLLADF